MLESIKQQSITIITELIHAANLQKNSILVVGCSSSEVAGHKIGSFSSTEIADTIFESIYPILKEKNIFLAAQCCEHLNRAIIVEKECMDYYRLEQVNVVPQPKAGGSFATAAYHNFENPVAVEFIKADAGIDIGGTLIGMHLKHVAVPIRLSISNIGEANIICARTRAKCIGGIRAIYNDNLM
ncbi:TIGR01440 family protein [Paludicola sp. MB14-C6]|uniref:TIGR01440 family protein n=1 Tax=Paludihabitans sp. MB14-C6 TaxID=3070656 RepID=UPI0027DC3F53|nr:TIGR01440 family protein [Paludicola sp. MB14-C6]WMJ22464.1 TIGR01440 family protein [Paludicola sp. MB14-C6]